MSDHYRCKRCGELIDECVCLEGVTVVCDEEGRKDDGGKLRLDLIPPEAVCALGSVLTMGAEKYDARNWEKGFDWGRSVAALKRHLTAWEAREDCDPESGYSHLWHVLTNAAFLVTFEARGVGNDDRPDLTGLDHIFPRGCEDV